MRPDDRPDGGGHDLGGRETAFDLRPQFGRAVRAVAVAYQDQRAVRGRPALFHPGKLRRHRPLRAAGLFGHFQRALSRNVQQRLDLQNGPHGGRRAGHPAAVFQVFKGVHREPVADPAARFQHPGGQFVQREALRLTARRFPHQEPFPNGRAEGVQAEDPPLRIAFPQFRGTELRGLAGGGHPGRKAEVQYVRPAAQAVLEGVEIDRGPDLGGGSELPRALGRIERRRRDAARPADETAAVQRDVHGQDSHFRQALHQFGGQVGGGIREKAVTHF